MKDQELKNLVASLAADTAKFKAENAKLQALNAAGFAALRESMRESQLKSERELASLTQSINDTRSEVDGLGKSQGLVAEAFYANSLTLNPRIGKLTFDQVLTSVKVGKGHEQAQFDVVLRNGNSVAFVEVKYRAQLETIAQLDMQMVEFRSRFPEYDNYKLYGGIASFSVNDAVVNATHDKGYFVLKRSGDAFAVDTQGMKAF
jgi:hypothetical protein